MKKIEIDIYRNQIDEIDKKMQDLFIKRMELSSLIGEYKENNSLPLVNLEREQEIKDHLLSRLNNVDLEKEYLEFLDTIIKVSKDYQRKKYNLK